MNQVKLHLGCGEKQLPGFIHIDQDFSAQHLDYCNAIDDLSMFADDSVDEIYNCGAFYYFDREEAPIVLREWHRVLKKGGCLRISLGDFEKIVEVYLQSGKVLESTGILGPLFGRWPITTPEGRQETIYQRTCYDFKSLSQLLQDNGFTDVQRYNWKDFLPEDYDDYSRAYIPHMDEAGLLLALNVECRKC